jgi:hypothetical protein
MEPCFTRRSVVSPPRRVLGRFPRGIWGALVFPAAVLAVHQLRYLLAYGSRAGSELSEHGDHYVAAATVITGTLVLVALVIGLGRLVASSRGSSHPRLAKPLWLLWLGLTLLLIAGFCALEGLESVFEREHDGGLMGIFGSGGIWAVPAAALVGALMALLMHGGHALLAIAAGRQGAHLADAPFVRARAMTPAIQPHRPMADCAAGRAPPLALLV